MGDLTPRWVKSRVWSRTCSYAILSTDNKGLTAPFLARIGVTNPTNHILTNAPPIIGRAYTLRSSAEILDMHATFNRHLTSSPHPQYSLFYAIQSVLGTSSAYAAAKNNRYAVPPAALIHDNN